MQIYQPTAAYDPVEIDGKLLYIPANPLAKQLAAYAGAKFGKFYAYADKLHETEESLKKIEAIGIAVDRGRMKTAKDTYSRKVDHAIACLAYKRKLNQPRHIRDVV